MKLAAVLLARKSSLESGSAQNQLMKNGFSTIGLTGNWRDPNANESIQAMARYLLQRGCTVIVGDGYAGSTLPDGARLCADADIAKQAQLLIAVGGDGTMLFASRRAAAAGIPLLGINRGRLGFLADISPARMITAMEQILGGQYSRDERMLLNAEVIPATGPRTRGLALNDVVVKRMDSGRMFDFQTFVDGRYVNTHGGDGFIVATPTGSTAYALSCGGPIVTPELDVIVLAPICPHTLSDRPIVIPGNSQTEIRLCEQDGDQAAVCCDGEVICSLNAGDRLRVTASEQRLELIHPPGHDFFEILRGKLHWGRGSHNDKPAA